jgi:uncharacterized protein YdhG (YjbR/CyaY superfamily)
MPKPKIKTVDDYVSAQETSTQPVLRRVREILRKALPGAEEVISYQIPAFRIHGYIVIFFAGWREHLSVYPVSRKLLLDIGVNPALHEVNEKGTLKIPYNGTLPTHLLTKIAKYRGAEAKERAELKQAASESAKAAAKAAKAKKKGTQKVAKKVAKTSKRVRA